LIRRVPPALVRCHVVVDSSCPNTRASESHNDWTTTTGSPHTEIVEGIPHSIICECKFWKTNIPAEKVRAFRVAVEETGANRGYIVSQKGFQTGAIAAARATNVELVTYEQFQELYFEKWFARRIWTLESTIANFNVYYEPGPSGRCGYDLLKSDDERAAYDEVWNKYGSAARSGDRFGHAA
ncbi:restriction endonuclease, partial [Mycobacterium bourgelatii]